MNNIHALVKCQRRTCPGVGSLCVVITLLLLCYYVLITLSTWKHALHLYPIVILNELFIIDNPPLSL